MAEDNNPITTPPAGTLPEAAAVDPDTGLTLAELERESRRRIAAIEANADPLPGPLAMAFPVQSIRVGSLAIRPVVAVDMVVLRHLESPLLKQMAEARKPKELRQETNFTDEDGWDMVLLFLLEPVQAEALVRRGRDQFRALSRQRIGMAMNPLVVNLLVEAVIEQFKRTFATAVEFAANPTGAESSPVFTVPPTAPKTGSVGGSNTSPG